MIETIKEESCNICGEEGSKLVKHHIIPEIFGGEETITICSKCHAELHWEYRTRAQKEIFSQNKEFFNECLERIRAKNKSYDIPSKTI